MVTHGCPDHGQAHNTNMLMLAVALAHCAFSDRTDDRDVIQTAMLGFFDKRDWYPSDWKPKHHVVLFPKYAEEERPKFVPTVRELVKDAQVSIDHINKLLSKGHAEEALLRRNMRISQYELKVLQGLLKQVEQAKQTYQPSKIFQPDSIKFESRIWVSAKSNRGLARSRDKKLEQDTVYATVSPPSYSPDGEFALLRLNAPWSGWHSVDVVLVFERSKTGWARLLDLSTFYV